MYQNPSNQLTQMPDLFYFTEITLDPEFYEPFGIRVEYQFIGKPPIVVVYNGSGDAAAVPIANNTLEENGVLLHETHLCRDMPVKEVRLESGRIVRAHFTVSEPNPNQRTLWLVIIE
jgi:hypothetical protein